MSVKPFENPLTPNRLLREIYLAMLSCRQLARSRRKPKSGIEPGLEALWTATAIGLRGHAEDLVSDPNAGPALDLILASNLKSALSIPFRDTRRLQPIANPSDRLHCALGAAMAILAAGQGGVLLAFVRAAELKKPAWEKIFTAATSGNLPIVIIVIPGPKTTFDLSAIAQNCSLPAIPVDARDPIAIYRVAQESIVRARAGGGPALISGAIFPTGSAFKSPDPLLLLSGQLLKRKACTQLWLTNAPKQVAPRKSVN